MQNRALITEEDGLPVAYITEVYFDREEAMQGAPVSPKGEAAPADPKNFTDVERPPS